MTTSESTPVPGIVPTLSTAETVHLPRLFVPDRCIEKCGRLSTQAALTTLEAAKEPTMQFDIVCHEASAVLRACGARQIRSGSYGNSFGTIVEGEETGFFLANPAIYQRFPDTFTVQSEIAKAVAEGSTEHSISEL